MTEYKTFFVFAGPNGSGKSTLYKHFKRNNPHVKYIGADYIAQISFSDIEDYQKRSIKAMQEAEKQLEHALRQGESVAFETVLSSDKKWRFFDLARKNGYTIISSYITTNNPDINWLRVCKRVSEGGHPVPEGKVRDRYIRSHSNLPKLFKMSDVCHVYDNSGDSPFLLMQKVAITLTIDRSINSFEWMGGILDDIMAQFTSSRINVDTLVPFPPA